MQADNVFDLMAKNQALVARRQSWKTPLIFGGAAFVLDGALLVSARSRSAREQQGA